jgi:hypothetical protein
LRTFAALRRPRFIHHQSASHESPPVAGLHRLHSRSIIIDLNKPKPSGLTTKTIAQDIHAVDVDAGFLKKRLQIGFGGLVGQIPYEKLCH